MWRSERLSQNRTRRKHLDRLVQVLLGNQLANGCARHTRLKRWFTHLSLLQLRTTLGWLISIQQGFLACDIWFKTERSPLVLARHIWAAESHSNIFPLLLLHKFRSHLIVLTGVRAEKAFLFHLIYYTEKHVASVFGFLFSHVFL